ncbi:hypothetical protein DFH09DRAFT_836603, partial [Mycena vulgaris]
MAELARHYHAELQHDTSELDIQKKDADIADVLGSMPPPPNIPDMVKLGKNLDEDDVRVSMNTSAKGVAAGVNGIPTELWSRLDEAFQAGKSATPDPAAPAPLFDAVKALTSVYNDIEEHGVEDDTDFA